MTSRVLVFLLTIVLCFVCCNPVRGQGPVEFSDASLKAAIEDTLWITDPTPADMLGLRQLKCIGQGVRDITGIEYAQNIEVLWLRDNLITDLSPLASLTNMHTLVLSKNWGISNVAPLSGLRNLEHLDLHHTGILNLGPLSNLHKLDTLILRENDISDLGPLSSLTNLRVLNLMHNLVRDVTPLASMTGLEKLGLHFNPLSDLTGLSELDKLKDLNLQYNPIDDLSEIMGLRNLESLDIKLIDFPAEVYCRQIPAILDNNPGMWLGCDANLRAPEAVVASPGDFANKVLLRWDAVCNLPQNTNYYRIYRSASETGAKTALGSWQTSTEFSDLTAAPGVSYVYWVQTAVSDSGSPAGPHSDPVTGWVASKPSLTVSSSAGGQVVDPGEGSFSLDENGTLSLRALPVDPNLYVFAGWSGTAVEAGKVADPNRAATEVMVDASYTVHARFETTLETLHVDANALADVSGLGTAAYPLRNIQAAVEVARDGTRIIVYPGVYQEQIVCEGKSIELVGAGIESLDPLDFPVIDANGLGPIVQLSNGSEANGVLSGFVLTRGVGNKAGAVHCFNYDLRLENCLITGNRAYGPDSGVIYCQHSDLALLNCTVSGNGATRAAIYAVQSDVLVRNAILWDNTPADLASPDLSRFSVTYSTLAQAWTGLGVLRHNPLFVEAGYWLDEYGMIVDLAPSQEDIVWVAGDYHLQSAAGRWIPDLALWAQDPVTSPAIDAGDPHDEVGGETEPHGDQRNQGVYGGTAQASQTDVTSN